MPAVRSKRICSGRGCRRRLPVPRTSSTPRTGTPRHRALPPTMSRIWLPRSPLSGLGSMPVSSGAVQRPRLTTGQRGWRGCRGRPPAPLVASWGTLSPICLVEVDRLRASPNATSGRGSWRPDGAATNRGAMAARSKKPTGGRRQAIDADAVVAEYAAWPPAVGRPEPGRLPGPDARLPHLAGRLRTRRSGPGGARRPGPSGAGLQAARADGQALGAEHGEPGLCGHRQLLPLNRRRPTGGGPGGAGPGRAPGIGEGRPAAVPASGRGLPVGAGPGDRHGVLLHRATPLRAGRPRGGRSVGLGPPGSVAGFARGRATPTREVPLNSVCRHAIDEWTTACLLYTSDAADEEDSVDLGGRRII